jgi:hypothetical protein
MRRAPPCLLAVAFACASFAAAAVEQAPVAPGEEKVTLMLGAFLPSLSTRARVDAELGSGDRVDLARDLGLDQNSVAAWIAAEWRFAPRHRVGFRYSRFTLSGERSLDASVRIDDETFPAGAAASSRLRLEIVPLTYSYSVLKDARDELALTAGLHWSRISLRVEGSASLGTQDLSSDANAKANQPLPLLGLRYDHHFSQRWSAGGEIGVFSLKSGKRAVGFEGSLWSARAHAEYRFSRYFGIGAALEGFRVKVDLGQDQWRGELENGYWGPQLYLTGRF